MSSVSSSTSSLSNSIRGYGGMASGLDRDALIEQMLEGMDTKIDNVNKNITKTEWKQEAYQSLSDKIIDLQDEYFGYGATSSLTSYTTYLKNQVSILGKSDVTQYVSATGTSSMSEYLSIQGVQQLATSAVSVSNSKSSSAITTKLTDLNATGVAKKSNLEGLKLTFGTVDNVKGSFISKGSFTFPSTYKETVTKADGSTEEVEKSIDYTTADMNELVRQLNLALKDCTDVELGTDDTLKFAVDGSGNLTLTGNNKDSLVISTGSSVFGSSGLNLKSSMSGDSISIDDFNNLGIAEGKLVSNPSWSSYLGDKKLSFTYGGQTKEISLSTDGETDLTKYAELLQKRIDKAFGSGKITVSADSGALSFDTKNADDYLTINSSDATLRNNLGITKNASNKISTDGTLVDNYDKLGFSSKEELEEALKNFTINGEKITGLSSSMTVDKMLETINNNTDAGVKASYLSGSNQFVLVATDTGTGREIEVSGGASTIFGCKNTLADNYEQLGFSSETELEAALKDFTINGEKITGLTKDMTVDDLVAKINESSTTTGVTASFNSTTNKFVLEDANNPGSTSFSTGASTILNATINTSKLGYSNDGKDAIIEVGYGNGLTTTIRSSSNTFDLEGLKVTVTGTFGYKTDDNGDFKVDSNGNPILDTTQSVSFSAKADVDGVTETVKKFIEEYNELVKELNTQLTTKPSSYEPLTDDEKDALDDTTIEKWEKKAKEGLLYGDSTLRSLSSDLQSIFTQFMSKNGLSMEMLEDIGISYSDDYLDGGTIVFDESKFKEAMESDPESVSNIFAGGGSVKTSFTSIIESTLTKYATRYASKNGNSYGLLIEEAGSSKIPTSSRSNQKFKELEDLQEQLEKLKEQRQTKEDRYITMFTSMETAISNMNTQSSYLSSLQS